MDTQQGQLVCAQCQGRTFAEDGFTLVCQCCGLQIEKQATRYEEDCPEHPAGSTLHAKTIGRTAIRKRDTIKEHVGTTRHGKRKAATKSTDKEDWSDYLKAYQKILKANGEAVKKNLGIENPEAFDNALKNVWFQYLNKWTESGVRLQGGFMEGRRGCFKMNQPGKLQKRYFIGSENVSELGTEAIEQENTEAYQKLYEKEYEHLKTEFYKKKAKAKKSKGKSEKKSEDSKADTQSQLI